jgi:hypothetical protein
MKTFTFSSIARPNWRYRLYERNDNNPAHNWRQSSYAISDVLSQFDTMGDGETQHSPDVLVQNEDFCDLLASLVVALHRIPVDVEEMPGWLRWFWRSDCASDEQIRFALALKYNPKRSVYYSLRDLKKSFNSDKRHDKRWELLWDYDGDCPIERAMRIICVESSPCRPNGIVSHVAVVLRIATIADKQCDKFIAQQFFKRGPGVFKDMDNDGLRALISNFEVITQFVDALKQLTWLRGYSQRVAAKQAESLQNNDVATVEAS